MRRNIRGKRPKRARRKANRNVTFILFVIFLILFFAFIYGQLDRQIMPTVLAMAEIKADTIATRAINQAVRDTLMEKNIQSQDLVMYEYNEQGEVISHNINTIEINELSADVIINIAEQLENIGITTLKVPLGNISGSRIFANFGPELKVQVLPIGTAKINYHSSFTSTGINQVNHRVWLDIDTMIQVVVPLASKQMAVSQEFTLVDRVMSGEVPPSYVNVPSDSILDVAPEENVKD